MEARRYRETDKEQLDAWWSAHNMPLVPAKALPKVGYMVQGVAAGFLYTTDSSVAFIENFISNPEAPWADRQRALDEVTRKLLRHAKEEGMGHLIALTTSQAIYNRALFFGFQPLGAFQVLNLRLDDKE